MSDVVNQPLAVLAAVKRHAVRSLLSIVGYVPLTTLGRKASMEGLIPNFQVLGGEAYGFRIFTYTRTDYESRSGGELLHETVNVGQILSAYPSFDYFEKYLKRIGSNSSFFRQTQTWIGNEANRTSII